MALRILAETYHGGGRRQSMADNEAREFKDAAEKALKEILAFPIGIKLRREIDSAAWDLSVLKAGRANNASLLRQGENDLDQACYKEVLNANLLYAKIGQLLSEGASGVTPAVKKFNKFYAKGQNIYLEKMAGAFTGTVRSYPIAHKGGKAAHTTENIVRDRVKQEDPPREIAEAEGYVRRLQNGLIGYHIMSHLTPGPGGEALVAWHPERNDAGADLDPSKRAAWMTRPSWIALVHELIHGWRLVTGQCVFRPDQYIEEYYEEAMTVGLPPYDGCRFTENKFRLAAGQAPRTFYGQSTRVISEAAQQKHKPMMDESVWAPGEANPPYDRLLQGTLTYRGQREEQFKRELEAVAVEAARKSTRKDLRVFIFGPIEQLDEIIKWTESTIRSLNRFGYEFRIRRAFFNAGTQQVRFYDHLRSG